MSRYVLQSKTPKFECAVGWDAPMHTFFGLVIDPTAKEEDEFIEWWGAAPREVNNARELVPLMKEYAEIPEEIITQLENDQRENPVSDTIPDLQEFLSIINGRKVLFPVGKLLATPGALHALKEAKVGEIDYLARHVSGDWGDIPRADKAANERALKDGARIFSGYLLPKTGVKIWVITEADRSATTILLPSEY